MKIILHQSKDAKVPTTDVVCTILKLYHTCMGVISESGPRD